MSTVCCALSDCAELFTAAGALWISHHTDLRELKPVFARS
jgi:hypothetical protein